MDTLKEKNREPGLVLYIVMLEHDLGIPEIFMWLVLFPLKYILP